MKALLLSICLVLWAMPAPAQNADADSSAPRAHLPAALSAYLEAQPVVSHDAAKYASRPVVLLSADASDNVMPMLYTVNGQAEIEFVSVATIKEALAKGASPIPWGNLISALDRNGQIIAKLQDENATLKALNEKLWKVAMKDAPQQQQPTVVVQQPTPTQPSLLERYMLLRSLNPQPQPYQLPMPVNPNANRVRANCVSSASGTTTYTNCN